MRLYQILENRQPIYHWTSLEGLRGMFKHGIISYFDTFHPTQGHSNPNTDYISFTRNKNYAKGASQVRLTYDQNILKNHKRIRPTRGIVAKDISGDTFLQGPESRFEAEELVSGPIALSKKDGLISIEITKELHDKILETIGRQENMISELEDRLKSAQTRTPPTFEDWKKFIGPNIRNMSNDTIERIKQLEKDPKWNPNWWKPESIKSGIVHHQSIIQEYKDILNKVGVI